MATWKARFRLHVCCNKTFRYLSRLPRYEAKCVQRKCFQWRSVPLRSDIKGTEQPLPIYWYHSKGNWLRYNFAADSFYIMKLCSRLFVLYCRNCPKISGSVQVLYRPPLFTYFQFSPQISIYFCEITRCYYFRVIIDFVVELSRYSRYWIKY